MTQVLSKCGLPPHDYFLEADKMLSDWWQNIMSMQPVLPGGEGTDARVSLMLNYIRDDEALALAGEYATRRSSHLRFLCDSLAAREEEAEPGPLGKEDTVSAPGRQRRSFG